MHILPKITFKKMCNVPTSPSLNPAAALSAKAVDALEVGFAAVRAERFHRLIDGRLVLLLTGRLVIRLLHRLLHRLL